MQSDTIKFDTRQSEQTAQEFHRLARVWPHFRWWTPILVFLWSVLAYLGIWLTTALLGLVLIAVTPLRFKDMTFGKLSGNADLSNPPELALALMIIVVLLPAVFLGARWARVSPLGLLSSVEARFRWRWAWKCLAMTGVVHVVSVPLYVIASSVFGTAKVIPAVPFPGLLISLVVILVLVPFQAAAEEYVFRGILSQSVGAWLKHPAFAILIPLPLFVWGHAYNLVGLLDVGIFGAAMGWITWKTGGLEAAVMAHIVGNLIAFSFEAFGSKDESAVSLVLDSVIAVVYVMWVVHAARQDGIQRTLKQTLILEHEPVSV
jgi:uncharacterized protein